MSQPPDCAGLKPPLRDDDGMRPLVLVVSLGLLLAPLASADHGGDPGDPSPLGPGIHHGVLGPGEDHRYVIEQPSGEGVIVTVRFAEWRHNYVALLAPDGRLLADGEGIRDATLRGGDARGRVHLRIALHFTEEVPATYDVEVSTAAMADMRVSILAMRSTPLSTRLGELPLSWAHEIDVRVDNAGTADGVSSLSMSARGARTSDLPEFFAWTSARLEPGHQARYTFSWNSTGTVGDIEIQASLFPRPEVGDMDHASDAAQVSHASLVGGLGVGVLPMDGWIHCSLGAGFDDGLCTWMEARAEGFDAVVEGRFGSFLVIVDVAARTGGIDADVCTDALAGHCVDRWGRWSSDDRA